MSSRLFKKKLDLQVFSPVLPDDYLFPNPAEKKSLTPLEQEYIHITRARRIGHYF